MIHTGWILDAAPTAEGFALWVLNDRGDTRKMFDHWSPRFFVGDTGPDVAPALERLLKTRLISFSLRGAERISGVDGSLLPLLEVTVRNPSIFRGLVTSIKHLGRFALYNAHRDIANMYFSERGFFPLARGVFETDAQSRLQRFSIPEDAWSASAAEAPTLRVARLTVDRRTSAAARVLLWTAPNAPSSAQTVAWHLADFSSLTTSVREQIEIDSPEVVILDDGEASEQGLISSIPGMLQAIGRTEPSAGVPRAGAGRWCLNTRRGALGAGLGLSGVIELARLSNSTGDFLMSAGPDEYFQTMTWRALDAEGWLMPWECNLRKKASTRVLEARIATQRGIPPFRWMDAWDVRHQVVIALRERRSGLELALSSHDQRTEGGMVSEQQCAALEWVLASQQDYAVK